MAQTIATDRKAYATSKQCNLATVMAFARETPRLRFNALEPGLTPNTGHGRRANAFPRFLLQHILPLFAPFKKDWSTPKRAARVPAKVRINASGQTGVYYDDGGDPMLGSALVRDPKFGIASLPRHAPCLHRVHNLTGVK